MIEATIHALAKQIGRKMTMDDKVHECAVIYGDIDSSSRERKFKAKNRSYLKPTNIATEAEGQNRKFRRLELQGKLEDGNYEVVRLIPCSIEFEWKIPLYTGLDYFYTILPRLMAVYSDSELNFTLTAKFGDENKDIDIIVKGENFGSVAFPEIEGDVDEAEPSINLSLIASNSYLVLSQKLVPKFYLNAEQILAPRVKGSLV